MTLHVDIETFSADLATVTVDSGTLTVVLGNIGFIERALPTADEKLSQRLGYMRTAAERSLSNGVGSAIAPALRMPDPRSWEKGLPSTSQYGRSMKRTDHQHFGQRLRCMPVETPQPAQVGG